MNRYWLRCNRSDGMFPSEDIITYTTAAGEERWCYADKSLVQESGGGNDALVNVCGEPGWNGVYHVIMPDGSCRTVSVDLIVDGKPAPS